ncbi:ImmA/IrrE family metallo-endopeptidase [Dubosiella newyorkensis]|uniref:ImmA/IrrE family metallo-endopeptidase n=1 Tax=Dubosiella newyorkensis TaxID=1862672 RepID=UPI0025882521|nr:ImmA/IrrE family metallo-endopeptidase [Dubosiella newyorkensis]
MNGTINGRPYIILNKNMTAERIRTTIVHELAHLFYQWPEDMDDKECEKYTTQIVGAFMISKSYMIRKLGIQRKAVTRDMCLVCHKYGIALSLLVVRAVQSRIITDSIAKKFFYT